MPFEKDPNECGALWLKHGSKGEWMSGTIDGIGAVVVFPVNSKSPKAPTYRVLKAKPRDEQPAPTGTDIGGGFTQDDGPDLGF